MKSETMVKRSQSISSEMDDQITKSPDRGCSNRPERERRPHQSDVRYPRAHLCHHLDLDFCPLGKP
jgi:hypothetical protein